MPRNVSKRLVSTIQRAYVAHDRFIAEAREWNAIYRDKTLADFIEFVLRDHEDDDFNTD
jgi:hypothetical protein